MPISAAPMSPTQTGFTLPSAAPGGAQNPFASLASPQVQMAQSPGQGGLQPNGQNIMDLLSKSPQSLTNAIMPYLQQLAGQQGGMVQGMFQQQGAQGAAQAQSDAMKRGLTGSSIEASGIQGAYTSANQGYNQFVSQMLGQLGQNALQTTSFDIQQNNDYYKTLANALGNEQAQQIQQGEFARQIDAGLAMGAAANRSQMWSSIIGGGATLGAGALIGFSDAALKSGDVRVGKVGPLGLYLFRYRQDTDLSLPKGWRLGFMAQEVHEHYRDCVKLVKGYLAVDYGRLREAMGHA